jgi:hypothetical protein
LRDIEEAELDEARNMHEDLGRRRSSRILAEQDEEKEDSE